MPIAYGTNRVDTGRLVVQIQLRFPCMHEGFGIPSVRPVGPWTRVSGMSEFCRLRLLKIEIRPFSPLLEEGCAVAGSKAW